MSRVHGCRWKVLSVPCHMARVLGVSVTYLPCRCSATCHAEDSWHVALHRQNRKLSVMSVQCRLLPRHSGMWREKNHFFVMRECLLTMNLSKRSKTQWDRKPEMRCLFERYRTCSVSKQNTFCFARNNVRCHPSLRHFLHAKAFCPNSMHTTHIVLWSWLSWVFANLYSVFNFCPKVNKLQKNRPRYFTPKKDARKEKLCRCGASTLTRCSCRSVLFSSKQCWKNKTVVFGSHDACTHLPCGKVVAVRHKLRSLSTPKVCRWKGNCFYSFDIRVRTYKRNNVRNHVGFTWWAQ